MSNANSTFPPAIDYCGRELRIVGSGRFTDQHGSPAQWYQDESKVLYVVARQGSGFRASRMSERALRMMEIRNANNRKVA